jgi:hypothetical protein
MSTPGKTGIGLAPGSRAILHQIARGFDDLVGRLQRAIEILPHDDPEITALEGIRDKAFHASIRAREAMGERP